MPSFTFSGFPSGQPAAITVTQGTLSDSGSVPTWGTVNFNVEEFAGEIVTTYGSGGAISITISGGDYAGTYTQDVNAIPLSTSALEASSLCLVRPVLSGTNNVGDILTVTPGLWIYEGADPGDPTHQIFRDGEKVEGESGLSYVLSALDQGRDIVVKETLGSVVVDSVAVTLPDPTLQTDAGGLIWYSPSVITTDGANNVTLWPNNITGADATFDLDMVPADVSNPVWNAANGYVELGGSNALRSSVPENNFIFEETQNQDRTVVVMLVADPVVAGFNSGIAMAVSWSDSPSGTMDFAIDNAWVGSASDVGIRTYGGTWIVAWSIANNGAATIPDGTAIFEYHISPTDVTTYINGVFDNSATITRAGVPSGPSHLTIGGRASATTTDAAVRANLYEVFATTSSTNANFFRTELATRHGIILP